MTVDGESTSWFLALLKPNCAKLAERNLHQQGFQTFQPMEERTRRIRGKFVTVLRPLFPGYAFVAVAAGAGAWRAVTSTRGISRLVGFGTAPASVPHDIIRELMQRCDTTGRLLPPERLKQGDKVRLTSGPFTEFIGRIDSIAPDQRVWVLLDLIGARRRVAVSADQLRMA